MESINNVVKAKQNLEKALTPPGPPPAPPTPEVAAKKEAATNLAVRNMWNNLSPTGPAKSPVVEPVPRAKGGCVKAGGAPRMKNVDNSGMTREKL